MHIINKIKYQLALPDDSISEFVKVFWALQNSGSTEEKFIILPDGYFDILFSLKEGKIFKTYLFGLSTKEFETAMPGNAASFAISFKLPAAEYILKMSIASLVDKIKLLPNNFWEFEENDFTNFKVFVKKITQKIKSLSGDKIDPRKQSLFNILYSAQGAVTVEEISKEVNWSSRQISRYFKSRFGLSLKSYCSILRYRASFEQLKNKELYPKQNYSDQAHFIKEVKKYSGVTPKHLAKNNNDRFIQLSTLTDK
ncbi:MAG: AraC family transcriptional regulator [Bacteroidetes bacterium]|nr:AraC family transcriptional regulator [Bacteroidota bacterium]